MRLVRFESERYGITEQVAFNPDHIVMAVRNNPGKTRIHIDDAIYEVDASFEDVVQAINEAMGE